MKHLYAEFSKRDDEQRMVYGYASTAALDSQGEIIKVDAIAKAMTSYMKFANIREMHQPSAVGVAKEASVDEKGLYIGVKVIDDRAWLKVKEGVYKAFSIGGRVKKRDPGADHIITEIELTEISLVDRPANPEALFEIWKFDGAENMSIKKQEDTPEAVAPEIVLEVAEKSAESATELVPEAVEPVQEVKKGLFEVAQLSELLASLSCVQSNSAFEAEREGDGSQVPARLKALVAELSSVLVQMVGEETAEVNAGKAEAAPELAKTEEAPAELAKAEEPATLAVMDVDALVKGELAKADALHADVISKFEGQVKELSESVAKMADRIKELEAEPLPAKGVLKAVAVSKAQDSMPVAAKADDGPVDFASALRKTYASGGIRIG